MLLASVTDSLVNLATNLIGSLGYGGVALLNATSGVIGVPGTEPTMLFAGFNVYEHHLTLVGIILFGLLGDLAGASVAWAIGYFGRQELLERHGAKIHMGPARLERANRWFERYGAPVLVVSRVIPFVRAVFPYAAGVGEMPYRRFIVLIIPGSLAWMVFLGVLGQAVGRDWQTWRHHLEYADYAAIAIAVALIAVWLVRRRQASARELPARAVPPVGELEAERSATPVDLSSRG